VDGALWEDGTFEGLEGTGDFGGVGCIDKAVLEDVAEGDGAVNNGEELCGSGVNCSDQQRYFEICVMCETYHEES
jgi:hypothetical protein